MNLYLFFANIQLEATVVSIVNFIFLVLFVYAGVRHAKRGVKENIQENYHDPNF